MGFGLHLTGWSNGDFNYDGVVNGADYALIDSTFNQITATGAPACLGCRRLPVYSEQFWFDSSRAEQFRSGAG